MASFSLYYVIPENLQQLFWSSQGWISDMWIDGPNFVPKSGYFLLILVKGLSSKVGFFLIF